MITYHKPPLIRVTEFYFDEDPATTRTDILRHYWRPAPLNGYGCEPSRTLVLDIASSPEALLANMHKETRYRIRRAEKDHFQYDFWPAGETEALAQFCRFFEGFAARKHLVPANRPRLKALAQLGVLDLSRVSDGSGRALVWHVHFRRTDRARGMYSASILGETADPSLRGLIGRANCYHTWCDILRFQQRGLALYDLGGWYTGSDDQEKLRINTFKQSFGGELVQEFNWETGMTARGKLALGCRPVLLDVRSWYQDWRPLRGRQNQTVLPDH